MAAGNTVRAVFVDLLNLFWDQHGIQSISAVLKKQGAEVYYVAGRHQRRLLPTLAALSPDVLLYSSFTSTLADYAAFDRLAKSAFPGVKSLIGGPGPTYATDPLAGTTIDAACIGEGEQAACDFIFRGFQGGPNILLNGEHGRPPSMHPLADLNQFPMPDRDVVYTVDSLLRNAPSKQFLSGRGCPYDCTYCFNHAFRELYHGAGPIIRKKSVDYLIDEIRAVAQKYPLRTVVFNDDTFIINKPWLMEFAERFPQSIGLPYTCNVRANLVDDDVARALKQSGCRNVNWSIESGNEHMRNEVLRRHMTNDQILNASECLRRHGLPYRIGNVIGLPGETFDQMLETLELNIRAKPAMGLANIFVPYPGLRLTQYAMDHGHFDPATPLPRDYFSRTVMRTPAPEKERVRKLMCLFPFFVSWPRLYFSRRLRTISFRLPWPALRSIYELYYTWKMMRMYVTRTPWVQRFRILVRYVRNL